MSDNGCGINNEDFPKIFDPLFTTKEKGKGTGLDLSTVYGIVKQSKGNMWAYSEPGQGTTFKIYLPSTDVAPKIETKNIPDKKPIGGGELILGVGDEQSLRRLVKEVLLRLDYEAAVAENGVEALDLAKEKGLKPDIIITAVFMPGMSGNELVDRLRKNQPDLKCSICPVKPTTPTSTKRFSYQARILSKSLSLSATFQSKSKRFYGGQEAPHKKCFVG